VPARSKPQVASHGKSKPAPKASTKVASSAAQKVSKR